MGQCSDMEDPREEDKTVSSGGLEIFGADSVLAEVELMVIFSRFWSSLGILI